MNENEKLVLKMNLLGGMDSYIKECIGDETVLDEWATLGVPDGADEEDLMEIANDTAIFAEIVHLFGKMVFNEYDMNC